MMGVSRLARESVPAHALAVFERTPDRRRRVPQSNLNRHACVIVRAQSAPLGPVIVRV
jgi:hypothetical protein